jgi:hypothetical protein
MQNHESSNVPTDRNEERERKHQQTEYTFFSASHNSGIILSSEVIKIFRLLFCTIEMLSELTNV